MKQTRMWMAIYTPETGSTIEIMVAANTMDEATTRADEAFTRMKMEGQRTSVRNMGSWPTIIVPPV